MAKLVIRWAVVGTLLLLVFKPIAKAQDTKAKYGDVEILVFRDHGGQASHGYTEWRFALTNHNKDKNHRVSLEFPHLKYGGSGIRSLSRTVEVGPGQTLVTSIFQPARPRVQGANLEVTIDGQRKEEVISFRPAESAASVPQSYRGGRVFFSHATSTTNDTLVLSSQRIPDNFFDQVFVPAGRIGPKPANPKAGGAGEHAPDPAPGIVVGPHIGGLAVAPRANNTVFQAQFIRSVTPISLWSSRWLAYTRFDLIALTPEDLEELQNGTPETRTVLAALWRYVETGGTLLVVGSEKIPIPASWKKTLSTNEAPNQVFPIYRPCFGACILASLPREKWQAEHWDQVISQTSLSASPWKSYRSLIDLNNSFPAVEDIAVPVRGLFALMILFSFIIGPVNLFILNRRRKRIWLLWTVPALSSIFCLMVIGYMIVAEGWRGHSRVAGFTILDETEKRATTLGLAAYYSPMTPGDGLRFSEDTEIIVLGNQHPAYSGNCAIDCTEGQHLSRGFVAARVPSHFGLRKSEMRRERITVKKEGDSLVIGNALGVDLQQLTLADANGILWTAGPVAAGATATMKREEHLNRKALPTLRLRNLMTMPDWTTGIKNAIDQPHEFLGPNSYLAVVEESPFLETGLKDANQKPTRSVVLGLMESN